MKIRYANEVDTEKAKSLLENAEHDLDSITEVTAVLEKKKSFGLLWSNRYEIIRQLVSGILLFEKTVSDNHKCLYAYLCMKHGGWEIEWETIETMRLLRNGIHYEGRPVSAETWQSFRLKFDVYTKSFLKILKQRIKEYRD